ncbi:MAG: PD-(D/E)XK nuclease family protein [Kiritimatiellia bacterium]
MTVRRHFLGWDEPVVRKAGNWLLRNRNMSEPVDLEGTLVVVPTRQAGRRLREELSRACGEHNTALLSALIVPPSYLFSRHCSSQKTAPPALVRVCWTSVLQQVDPEKAAFLFPAARRKRDFPWAMNTGSMLEDLRRELSDGAYTISSVAKGYSEQLEEAERWQALAELEELYLAELNKSGLEDPWLARIQNADSPDMEPGIERIICAAMPDPTLLAIQALRRLSEDYPVDILVHAPPAEEQAFDEWGRPLPEKWCSAQIDIPDWKNAVFLESDPASESSRVLFEIDGNADFYESGEIAIGVPDRSVIPFLEKDLETVGLPAFDPSDAALAAHPLGRVAVLARELAQTRTYRSVSELLRHPDCIAFLEENHGIKARDFLDQLDRFQNYYLPGSFTEMLERFDGNPRGAGEKHEDFTELGKALSLLENLSSILEKPPFETAWRNFLTEIFRHRRLSSSSSPDVEFENAASAMDEVLREFRELPPDDIENAHLSAILANRLSEKTYHRERREEVLDLEGWLELPWNDRPFMIVTGMNDEFVPGGSLSDTFLPDSLRAVLDLRDDSSRFARDVFLMNGMIRSRENNNGCVRFVLAKTGMSGDPCKPSRLLFRCRDEILPDRVEKLVATPAAAAPLPYAEPLFSFKTARVGAENNVAENRYISVTALADYLECPFRFYLKHAARMEPLDDLKTGIDSLDFGTLVHDTLKVMGRDRSLWACTDGNKLADSLRGIVEGFVRARYGPNPPLSVDIALMSAVERLKAFASVQVDLVREGWEILETEAGEGARGKEKQRWLVKRDSFTVSGRIDRIDVNSRTGNVRIIDYKTSNRPLAPSKAHLASRSAETPDYNRFSRGGKSGYRWINLQLPLYAMIYSRGPALPENLELAYLNLPRAVSETRISLWNDFDETAMKSAVTCLDGVLRDIASGIFWPPSARTRHEDPFGSLFLHDPGKIFDLEGSGIRRAADGER